MWPVSFFTTLKQNQKRNIINYSLMLNLQKEINYFLPWCPSAVRAHEHVRRKCLRTSIPPVCGGHLEKKKSMRLQHGAVAIRVRVHIVRECQCHQVWWPWCWLEGGRQTPALALDLSLEDCGWKRRGREGRGAVEERKEWVFVKILKRFSNFKQGTAEKGLAADIKEEMHVW